jgi:hypothetical protein
MLSTCNALRTFGRGLWWSITPLIGVAGVAGSYVLLGTGNAVLVAALAAFLATATGWILRSQPTRPRRVPPLPLIGVLGGAAGLAVVGLLLEVGPVGLAISAALAATGWPVLRRSGHRAEVSGSRCQGRTEATRPVGPALEHLPRDPLPSLSSLCTLGTPELCRTWQLTYPRLRRATSPAETEHLTELRRGCLAELEQRDPAAFGRWLPTARAASDPARFFCRWLPRATGGAVPEGP